MRREQETLPQHGAGRRAAIRLAVGAALLPLLARTPVRAQDAAGARPFAPPSGPMTYRRELVRSLPGGAQMRVMRDFAVRFLPVDGGFEVSGAQVGATVEAPDNLAHFAELERARVESGMFPLRLDHAGRIVDGAEAQVNAQFAEALEEVRRRMGGSADEVRTLVEALHATGARMTAMLPRDLFAPAPDVREERERIALPWGDTGEVVTVFAAACDPVTGLMREARREVVTRLGADERRSGEYWALFAG